MKEDGNLRRPAQTLQPSKDFEAGNPPDTGWMRQKRLPVMRKTVESKKLVGQETCSIMF